MKDVLRRECRDNNKSQNLDFPNFKALKLKSVLSNF